MEKRDAAPAVHSEVADIMGILEQQLARLDRVGARIAAAHLDTAIQQLRLDMIDLDRLSPKTSSEMELSSQSD